ncbi:MAG: ABC transporter ATP-binding protein [Planctomycetota bacterium]
MDTVLRATDLVKRFGELVAVDGVSLSVQRGTCLGLLGPNGAGKTTTIEMIEGLKQPDSGSVELFGLGWQGNGEALRERIGVQLQETDLLERLTVFEILRLFQSFYTHVRPLEEVLRDVGLEEKRDARTNDLSGGQKQRLTLGTALVNRPELLFLDEPTTGLDPQARRRVWEIVEGFKREGGAVLLTTHYMEEAERLADNLVIVDRGKIIAEGTPAALIAKLGVDSVVELVPADGTTLDAAALAALPSVESVRREGAAYVLTVTDAQAALRAAIDLLELYDVRLDGLHTHRPTLEDVFVALTGKHLRDG